MVIQGFCLSKITSKEGYLVGNKAARLGELMSAGFPVPDGFCIPVNSYLDQINSGRKKELIQQGTFDEIRESLRHGMLNNSLQQEILTNYRKLQASHPGPVAVRSSSTAEDLSGHSFAGLYETILHVTDESMLLDAVRACWASYWSDEAVSYRDQIGMDHTKYGMAVLVQSMISAKYAGVLFTHAPTDRDLSLVEFVAENGSVLVDGTKYSGRYLVERDTGKLREAPALAGLSRESLDYLISMGRAIAERLGGPQDIEWCLDDEDRIWALQARPITTPASAQTARGPSIPAGMERVYDEPFSALGCDLAVRRHKVWLTAINRFHHTTFPFYATTDNVFVYRTTPWRSAGWFWNVWMKLWKSLRWLQADHIQVEYDQSILPGYVRRLTELRERNLAELTDDELLAGLDLAVDAYLEFQSTSYAVGEVAVLAASLLERLSKFIPGERLDFLSGLNTITVERDIALHDLAKTLNESISSDALGQLDYSNLARNPELHAFLANLQKFQDSYGYVWADRYPRDPAWQVNYEALMASLQHAASGPGGGVASSHAQRGMERSRNIEKAAERLARFPVRWFLLRSLLRRAERLFPYKEDRNHFVYQGVMVIQKYARAIGLRFQSQGILDSSEDIFFMTWDEIQRMLPHGLSQELVSKIETGKMAYRLQVQEVSRGERGKLVRKPSKGLLQGDPCSPGVGSGIARLICGPGDLQRVGLGEVMVCRHFRPAWSTVFARLSGVVIEEGGTLSHGATLAREYGIPAVINVPGAMQTVQDGSHIVVDGTRGLVLLNDAVTVKENL